MIICTRLFVVVILWATVLGFSLNAENDIIRVSLQGKWGDVRKMASEFITPRNVDPEIYLLLGYASLDGRDWINAWKHFSFIDNSSQKERLLRWAEKLCSSNSNNGIAFMLKGDILARLGRYNEAILAVDQAIKFNGNLVPAYDIKGLIWIINGNLEKAAEVLDRILGKNASRPNTLFERGMVDLIGGNFENAVKRFTSVLDEERGFFLARNARGVAYLLQVKYDPALNDFAEALLENPSFEEASNNRNMAAIVRARGLFILDREKLITLSPKGILGAKASTNLYYAGAGINSPDGGQVLYLAKQRSGNALVITIREKDYIAQGLTAQDPRTATTIATYVSMQTRQAKAQGKDIVVSVIPDYMAKDLTGDYMFKASKWKQSTDFCAVAMDATLNGYRQVEKQGKTYADIHSQHGDAFAKTNGLYFDQVNAYKIRTGGGLFDNFANRCRDYKTESKEVNLFTGKGDLPSLWNTATKSIVDKLVQQGLVNAYHDKINHGHSVFSERSLYEVREKGGKSTVVGDIMSLTRRDIPASFSQDSSKPKGVFVKLGDTNMDVTRQKHANLDFLHGCNEISKSESKTSEEDEPDISYSFLLFNPSYTGSGKATGDAK